jgi:hypothetical protein
MKKLEELLNLPESKEIIDSELKKSKTVDQEILAKQQKTFQTIAEMDKIAAALPAVDGLGEVADRELNDIAEKALQSYDDIMDLGMNVEPRFSARLFEVANNMLRTGLDAKIAKLDKKLKMVDLQLKKEKLEKDNNESGYVEGKGVIVTDRNSLLEQLKGMNKDK